MRSHPNCPLGPRARAGLLRGLDALDRLTRAPVRLRGHASAHGHEVFDVQEEFEIGPPGRRFIVSVGPHGDQAMVLAIDGERR